MLYEDMNYISLSGEEHPIRCDLLVLEKIQDKFGDVSEFENKLIGFSPARNDDGTVKKDEEGRTFGTSGPPDIHALIFALQSFVEEGNRCLKKEGKEGEDLLRAVDLSPKELSEALHKEFMRCFQRKNQEPTQDQTMKEQNR